MIVEIETIFYKEEELLRLFLDGKKCNKEEVLVSMDKIFHSKHKSILLLSVAAILFWENPYLRERWPTSDILFDQEAQKIFLMTIKNKENTFQKKESNIRLVRKVIAENIFLEKIKTKKTKKDEQEVQRLSENQKKILWFLFSCNKNGKEKRKLVIPLLGLLKDSSETRNQTLEILLGIIQKTSSEELKEGNIHEVLFEHLKEDFFIYKDNLSFNCLTDLIEKTENCFNKPFFLKTDSILEIVLENELLCFIPKLTILLKESFIRFLSRTMEIIQKQKGEEAENCLKAVSKVCWARMKEM